MICANSMHCFSKLSLLILQYISLWLTIMFTLTAPVKMMQTIMLQYMLIIMQTFSQPDNKILVKI